MLLVMTVFGSLGGVCFKLYASRKRTVCIFTGLMLYGLGASLNIYLLRQLPYTVVVPANALTFVWTLLFAKRFFKEPIGMRQICGVGIIIAGLLMLIL